MHDISAAEMVYLLMFLCIIHPQQCLFYACGLTICVFFSVFQAWLADTGHKRELDSLVVPLQSQSKKP